MTELELGIPEWYRPVVFRQVLDDIKSLHHDNAQLTRDLSHNLYHENREAALELYQDLKYWFDNEERN